ncbi:MAG TPA: flippase [Solirubrobacteraceae bacterium]|nr:flippase [Solirubrobacteraceae bacterium]
MSARVPPRPTHAAKAEAVSERAIANTAYRGVGEIVGRLASLAMFALVARKLGESGLGAFVFGIAYLGFVMVAVDLGLDRYILRVIARERSSAHHLFFNVIALKLAIALPLFTLAMLALDLVGYSSQAQETTLALTLGVLSDSIARTQLAVFSAHERGGPPAVANAFQRICSAGLGIAALQAGLGVVAVGASYSIGSLLGLIAGFALMARSIGVPARSVSRRRWRALASSSVPFAAQDTFSILLARMDTLILSVFAAQAAVGRYGAAYRLFESTFFITYALTGAFAAMYTYLGPDSDPPLRAVVQRSLKLAVVLLAPVAVAFLVLAEPICHLIYGTQFSAAAPLRLLAPGVVLMGVVTLGVSLLVSRENPRRVVLLTAVVAVLNIALNLVLIPLYGVIGAASAMLVTEVIYAAWVLRRAERVVGGLRLRTTLVGALTAALAMTAVSLPLRDSLLAGLLVGGGVYLMVLVAIERVMSPRDVRFALSMIRRRLPRGAT